MSEMIADDTVWHVAGRSPIAGTYNGRDGVFALFARLGELTNGTFAFEERDFADSDEHSVVLSRASAQRGDRTLEANFIEVVRWHNGRVVGCGRCWKTSTPRTSSSPLKACKSAPRCRRLQRRGAGGGPRGGEAEDAHGAARRQTTALPSGWSCGPWSAEAGGEAAPAGFRLSPACRPAPPLPARKAVGRAAYLPRCRSWSG
jgi:hypothetical protein